MPSFINFNEEKETVVKVKKSYNTLMNAYTLARLQFGPIQNWGWATGAKPDGSIDYDKRLPTSQNALDKLSTFMNVLEKCPTNNGCGGKNYSYYNLNKQATFNTKITSAKVMLQDGSIIILMSVRQDCTPVANEIPKGICGWILYDTNGNNGPNTYGLDVFSYSLTSEGIIPYGIPNETYSPITTCKTSGTGTGCTAWVLQKENMDYLKRNISWNE